MSALDQPLLIANSNYHVGHEITVSVAEEQGFFREEGFSNYIYENRGLIPGPFERQGLALAVKEHGVDIVTAVNVESVVFQCSKGADLHIVGGWRYESTPDLKWYAAKHITRLHQLRGGKIGIREIGGLTHISMANALRKAGLNPDDDVEWVCDPSFAYRNNPAHLDMLRTGKVDAMTSAPPLSKQLETEGYPVLMDPKSEFPRGRPGKVIAATARTIQNREKELSSFLRGIIRAFWFKRDPGNFESLRDLETRLRRVSHNEEERRLSIVTGPEKLEGWPLPIDGGVRRELIESVIDEMVTAGDLEGAIRIEKVLVDGLITNAYTKLCSRPELQEALQKARAAAEKYGF